MLVLSSGCAASAQQDASAMAKLHWMAGSWTCAIVGNHLTGPKLVDHLTYRFVAGKNAKAFDWVIVSADNSTTVREECKR
jgi:hypothetical protein